MQWARSHDAVVISDECYSALAWEEPFLREGVPSLLDERVCDGDPRSLIVLYSLSKQSNLAGYRAALMYGDPQLLAPVIEVRKHSGMMVPAPVQAAMRVALEDAEHVEAQRQVYARRREILIDAIARTGLDRDKDSAAGLYLWVRDPRGDFDSWQLVDAFAQRGIVVAPGDFYGEAGAGFVRVALTATDERVAEAASRLIAQPIRG